MLPYRGPEEVPPESLVAFTDQRVIDSREHLNAIPRHKILTRYKAYREHVNLVMQVEDEQYDHQGILYLEHVKRVPREGEQLPFDPFTLEDDCDADD